MGGAAFSGVTAWLVVGLFLLPGLSATAPPTRHPRVQVKSVAVTSRTPTDDHLRVTIAVEGAEREDQLLITVVSFATCSSPTASRADHEVEVFDESVASRTIVQPFVLPRAARHEVTVTLLSTDATLGPTQKATDFGSTKEGCR